MGDDRRPPESGPALAELQRQYREVLPGWIAALEAAARALPDPGAGGAESARRIAHALRGSGATFGYPAVSAAAAGLEDATDGELPGALAALIGVLYEVAGAAIGGVATILVVEDDPAWLPLLRTALEAPRRRLLFAASAAEADAAVTGGGIALVVLDLVLPDGDGRNLLLRWRERAETAALPVVVVTGRTLPHVRSECLALGADAFFEKPADPAALATAVADALRRAAERTAAAAPAPPPAAPMARIPDSAPAPPAERTGPSVRVLLAEDDDIVAALVRHRLGREGREVVRCADGAEAARAAAEGGFGLGVFDVKLPGLDGFALLERVRALPAFQGVPVIMLTSMGSEDDVLRGLRLGADDYVVKPFSPAELIGRARRLLARR